MFLFELRYSEANADRLVVSSATVKQMQTAFSFTMKARTWLLFKHIFHSSQYSYTHTSSTLPTLRFYIYTTSIRHHTS